MYEAGTALRSGERSQAEYDRNEVKETRTYAFLGRNGHSETISPFFIRPKSVRGPHPPDPSPKQNATASSASTSSLEKNELPLSFFLAPPSSAFLTKLTVCAGSSASLLIVYSRRIESEVRIMREEAFSPHGCQVTWATEGEAGRQW